MPKEKCPIHSFKDKLVHAFVQTVQPPTAPVLLKANNPQQGGYQQIEGPPQQVGYQQIGYNQDAIPSNGRTNSSTNLVGYSQQGGTPQGGFAQQDNRVQQYIPQQYGSGGFQSGGYSQQVNHSQTGSYSQPSGLSQSGSSGFAIPSGSSQQGSYQLNHSQYGVSSSNGRTNSSTNLGGYSQPQQNNYQQQSNYQQQNNYQQQSNYQQQGTYAQQSSYQQPNNYQQQNNHQQQISNQQQSNILPASGSYSSNSYQPDGAQQKFKQQDIKQQDIKQQDITQSGSSSQTGQQPQNQSTEDSEGQADSLPLLLKYLEKCVQEGGDTHAAITRWTTKKEKMLRAWRLGGMGIFTFGVVDTPINDEMMNKLGQYILHTFTLDDERVKRYVNNVMGPPASTDLMRLSRLSLDSGGVQAGGASSDNKRDSKMSTNEILVIVKKRTSECSKLVREICDKAVDTTNFNI